MKNILSILTVALLLTGCAHRLEPGGAYYPPGQQADFALYAADAAYDLAYSTLDTVFKVERDNRAALFAISPNIKHALDDLRLRAWGVNVRWAHARQAYLANPVPSNLTALQEVLAHAQQLAVTAQAVIPNGGNP